MKRLAAMGGVVGLQAVGSIATLTSVVLIARTRGAEIQGTFGIVKAEVDLLVALLLVGMPQAIFYFSRRGLMQWPDVRRVTLVQSILAGVAAVAILAYRHPDAWQGLAPGLGATAIAVAALVAHGNCRGAVLHSESARVFSAVTALPGLFLLLGVVIALGAGALTTQEFGSMGALLAATGLAAGVVAGWIAGRRGDTQAAGRQRTLIAHLFGYGMATWIPAVGQTLSPVIALGWIHERMGDSSGVGVFSAAILATNLILTPFAMLVPLLFRRWVDVDGASRWGEMRRAARWLAPACLGFAGLVLLLEKSVFGSLFGPEYVARGAVFATLALAIWPQTVNRLLGVAFNAAGRPWLGAAGEVARVTTLAAGLALLQVRDLVTLAVLWVIAEFVAAAVAWSIGRSTVRGSA